MESAQLKDGIPGRGVYEAPFLVDGHRALLAVNTRGVVRKVAKLLPGASYERVMAALETWLDRDDPLPPPVKLELVRDRPAPKRPPRKLHPCHANDFHAYRRRLISQISQRVHVFRD